MKRRRQDLMDLYKWAINECCWPGCKSNRGLDTHHIELLSKGGIDTYSNYIILCKECHRRQRIHSFGYEKRIEILVYKFYKEKLIVGYCSDDFIESDYTIKLKNEIRSRKFQPDFVE